MVSNHAKHHIFTSLSKKWEFLIQLKYFWKKTSLDLNFSRSETIFSTFSKIKNQKTKSLNFKKYLFLINLQCGRGVVCHLRIVLNLLKRALFIYNASIPCFSKTCTVSGLFYYSNYQLLNLSYWNCNTSSNRWL